MTVDEFITKWKKSGGNERANTQLFINDLCSLLGVEPPQPTLSNIAANDYVFERHVIKTEIDGTTSNGWIDCYKRDSFILEAKQGSVADLAAVESGTAIALRTSSARLPSSGSSAAWPSGAPASGQAQCSVLQHKPKVTPRRSPTIGRHSCSSQTWGFQYHDIIDAAVAEAYGWPDNLTDQEILERLVSLNKRRAAEEAEGEVKWLRPGFQKPGYTAPKEQKALALPEAVRSAEVVGWPTTLPEQFTAFASVVDRAARPIAANDVARAFKGKNAKGITPVLDALAGMGRLRKLQDGRYAALANPSPPDPPRSSVCRSPPSAGHPRSAIWRRRHSP